jgi:transcriptional regulator with XRE-family HTH domain
MPAEDPLEQLRADLLREEASEEAEADETKSDEIARQALSFLQAEDLDPLTHFLVARLYAEDLPEGAEARAKQRVARAVARLREHKPPEPGSLLREAREAARLSLGEAAATLGLAEAAIDRIERGRGTRSLLNVEPRALADYVRKLNIDPRILLSALFAVGPAEAVYGYTPRVSEEERSKMLSQAAAESRTDDRRWAADFLSWAERQRD